LARLRPVEKALPVDCDIKSLKIQGKGGLVLIHARFGMADGNRWQKEIAKLAIKKLSPNDMMGMIYYAGPRHVWHIPFGNWSANGATSSMPARWTRCPTATCPMSIRRFKKPTRH